MKDCISAVHVLTVSYLDDSDDQVCVFDSVDNPASSLSDAVLILTR